MKVKVYDMNDTKCDPNYTLQQLGQIYVLKMAEKEHAEAKKAFYEAVDMNDEQVALLQKYLSLVIDTQSQCSVIMRDDRRRFAELNPLRKKAEEAEREFLNAVPLNESQRALFEKYSTTTGMTQKEYMETVLDGVSPLHIHTMCVPSFKEVIKRLKGWDEFYTTNEEIGNLLTVSASYISKLESGKAKPTDMLLKLIFHEYGISYEFLKATREVE